jgi:hypothetical protein
MPRKRPAPEHQLTIKVPAEVIRELRLRAAARGETIRTTILRALVRDGLRVPEAELVDRRGSRS